MINALGFRSAYFALAITGCSIMLSIVAIANGYPLVFPDTGAYLSQAIEFRGEPSRPPYYSLFLLPIHLGVSLWPVVVAQGAIMAGVLYLAISTVFAQKISLRYLLVVTCLLTMFTSLPWHTSQILPDIFSSILILAVYIVVFGWDSLSLLARIFIIFVLFSATAFHYSHLPLLAVTGGVALLLAAWCRRSVRGAWIPASLIVVAGMTAAAAFVAYNYAYAGRASLSLDSSKFLLARLIGDGTAVKFLRQTCPNGRFVLCDYLDEIQEDHNVFLWDANSPWRHVEHTRGFLGARDEAAAIVQGTLLNFPAEQAIKSVENLATQFLSFGTGDTLCPCIGDAAVNQIIFKHFTSEHDRFLVSRQNRDALHIDFFRTVHTTAVVVAALGCIAFVLGLFRGQNTCPAFESRMFPLIVITVAGITANAILTGILSGPADRYQSRVVWLIVFNFLLVALPTSPRKPPCVNAAL